MSRRVETRQTLGFLTLLISSLGILPGAFAIRMETHENDANKSSITDSGKESHNGMTYNSQGGNDDAVSLSSQVRVPVTPPVMNPISTSLSSNGDGARNNDEMIQAVSSDVSDSMLIRVCGSGRNHSGDDHSSSSCRDEVRENAGMGQCNLHPAVMQLDRVFDESDLGKFLDLSTVLQLRCASKSLHRLLRSGGFHANSQKDVGDFPYHLRVPFVKEYVFNCSDLKKALAKSASRPLLFCTDFSLQFDRDLPEELEDLMEVRERFPEVFASMPHLSHFELGFCQHNISKELAHDMLRKLPQSLQRFTLRGFPSLSTFLDDQGQCVLPHRLSALVLFNANVKSLDLPSELKQLHVLHAELRGLNRLPSGLEVLVLNDVTSTEPVRKLPTGLQELRLSRVDNIENLDAVLKPLTNLRSLALCRLKNVSSVDALPRQITKLFLGEIMNVSSLDGLPSGLQILSVAQASKITSLNHLPRTLTKLILNKMPQLDCLDQLPAGLQHLEIYLVPSSIQSLLHLPSELLSITMLHVHPPEPDYLLNLKSIKIPPKVRLFHLPRFEYLKNNLTVFISRRNVLHDVHPEEVKAAYDQLMTSDTHSADVSNSSNSSSSSSSTPAGKVKVTFQFYD